MLQDIKPHIFDNQYDNRREPRPNDLVLIYDVKKVILIHQNALPTFEFAEKKWHFGKEAYTYLLSVDKIAIFLVTQKVEKNSQYNYESVQNLKKITPKWVSFLAITATHLAWWYENHHFCSNCGYQLVKDTVERALVCNQCHQKIYPTISPAIIVAVTNGNKLLLTKFLNGYDRYALISGYAEIGETLEDTVRREVSEEVGLSVKEIKYYGSQPWAFSHSLLVGFTAKLDHQSEIKLELDELSKAKWFEREQIPHDDVPLSLTWNMIEAFRNGEY